jgi:hypothetical protein
MSEYVFLTEGFETPDPRAAKALLQELDQALISVALLAERSLLRKSPRAEQSARC